MSVGPHCERNHHVSRNGTQAVNHVSRGKRVKLEKSIVLKKFGASVVAGKATASPIVVKPNEPTESDMDFKRNIVLEAVFAWQDAPPVARPHIERFLFNVGVRKIGEPGERVTFSGAIHRTDDDIIPGETAVVSLPGWELQTRRGTFLLSPVMVRKV